MSSRITGVIEALVEAGGITCNESEARRKASGGRISSKGSST